MKLLDPVTRPLRRLDLERWLEMRPAYPPVAVEIDRGEAVLVRVKLSRRNKAVVEAVDVRELPNGAEGASMFRPHLGAVADTAKQIKAGFERTGTKPGKVSLVLPDNLAKVSIVALSERPPTRQQLHELLRFKLRRSVPFRMEDAVVSWQQIPADGPGVVVLAAVMLRSVVEHYEAVLEAVGARPGLVDLCTPSLFNFCRAELRAAAGPGGDAALLNCAHSYFTLLIIRGDAVVFYRCKSFGATGVDQAGNGMFERELASSISYYREKLQGRGIGTVLVRTAGKPLQDVAATLLALGVERVVPVDVTRTIDLGPRSGIDLAAGQRIAPALGAALGRGRS